MIGIGIVGYGYWGPNVVRNFAEAANARVVAVCDGRPDRLALVSKRYPGVQATPDYRELLSRSDIDAVAIVTPVASHFDLAMRALQAGKHVLVEKPMCATTDEALRLIDEAERRARLLAVDHTFVYTPAVQKIRELVTSDGLGDIYYYDSVRVNLGLFQHDVNVLWDLAVHDLSIMDHVLPAHPCAISATGLGHVAGEPENIGYLTLFFDQSLIAHVHVNWLAPLKVRRTFIGGSRKMIVYDDLEPSEKVKVYDKGITLNGTSNGQAKYQMLVGYRTGDMWAPKLDVTEALAIEARQFIDCLMRGGTPTADAQAGLRVVQLLEAATRSMRERGRVIELDLNRCAA